MTEDTGTNGGTGDTSAADDDDDGLPIFEPPFGLDDVPGFCERLVDHLISTETGEEFTFEGVEGEQAQGVWILPLGGYDPKEDRTLTEGAPADRELPPGGYAEVADTWAQGVRRVLRESWGTPLVRTPKLVGVSMEPEGILDYLMVAVRIEEAEMWDRGALCCVLLTSWDGEPMTSMLRQILVVMPREYAFGGMAVLADDEITVHDLLMHGEHLTELRRRAWLMSALAGQGEVRVRDTALEASRFSLRARNGTTTVWTFTDDGRALVLMQDPQSDFVSSAAEQLIADQLAEAEHADEPSEEQLEEAQLILIARMLDGVPEDLRELIAARTENGRGEPAEHELEFRMLGDQPLPLISGAVWFDGEHWRVTRSLLEIGSLNDFGMDDFGFAEAVRKPYRLGGSFTLEDFSGRTSEDRRAQIEQVFAACPYPEQPRPSDAERLGYGLPRDTTHAEMVLEIERATEKWWDFDPEQVDVQDRTFRVGGRELRAMGGRVLRSVIALAEPWSVDVLQAWVTELSDAMENRWGPAFEMQAREPKTGVERKTPVARVMRAVGLMNAPMWWVNGHAVLLIAGAPDPSYAEEPQAIIVIGRADAVIDLMRGTRTWELRQRTRVIGALAAQVAGEAAPHEISWRGPSLAGSDLRPNAVRGRIRADDHYWVWHFAHDGRGLLMSYPVDDTAAAVARSSFEDQAELFRGVPVDLLSLVTDRDPAGLYRVVTRPGGADPDRPPIPGLLRTATSLPAVQAVFWRDESDWRASTGMLQQVRPAAPERGGELEDATPESATPDTSNPFATLYSDATGVPQLQWAVGAGESLTPDILADDRYSSVVFGNRVTLDEAEAAYAQLGDVHQVALTGTLNQFLDTVLGMPARRYVLDAALANPDPRNRRELAMLLLEDVDDIDASIQLSHLTPINVLFENPTLEADDLLLLIRLLEAGAQAGPGLGGSSVARHPLVQLADRDAEEAEFEPLVHTLLMRGELDLHAPALPDGRSVLDYVEAGVFPHRYSRAGLLAQLREAAAA
ncbi:hypothetical protein [Leucobacter sp. L43]|uniref:hypothetical protein n=1 Tax=Leucobacter sp. L43 TaxID=2798040 RepID=UPI00190410A7|nr:hypothetical protein [Leucobacter sp. L43]